jgi:hypothetical protein
MRSLTTNFKAHEAQIVLALICCFSVTFLLWFLVGLVRDEMRMRAKRSRASRKRNYQVGVRDRRFQVSRARLIRIASSRPGSGTLKMVWLIFGILLATTIRLAAQNTNHTPTTPPPPNPLPTPSLTGPLQVGALIEFDAVRLENSTWMES